MHIGADAAGVGADALNIDAGFSDIDADVSSVEADACGVETDGLNVDADAPDVHAGVQAPGGTTGRSDAVAAGRDGGAGGAGVPVWRTGRG